MIVKLNLMNRSTTSVGFSRISGYRRLQITNAAFQYLSAFKGQLPCKSCWFFFLCRFAALYLGYQKAYIYIKIIQHALTNVAVRDWSVKVNASLT